MAVNLAVLKAAMTVAHWVVTSAALAAKKVAQKADGMVAHLVV